MYEKPEDGADMLMLGMSVGSSQKSDQFLTEKVTTHLFTADPPFGLGIDLAALDIQRGRDHGIPGLIQDHFYNHLIVLITF